MSFYTNCPYCGDRVRTTDEVDSDFETGDCECPSCKKTFEWVVEADCSARELPPEQADPEYFDNPAGPIVVCNRCGTLLGLGRDLQTVRDVLAMAWRLDKKNRTDEKDYFHCPKCVKIIGHHDTRYVCDLTATNES